jgi:hypothetical protein
MKINKVHLEDLRILKVIKDPTIVFQRGLSKILIKKPMYTIQVFVKEPGFQRGAFKYLG